MKTKLLLLLTACLILFSICTTGQSIVTDKQAMTMLKEFYTAYMMEVASSDAPKVSERKLDLLKKKYCTTKLIRNIPELAEKKDCDPIIYAQDSNMECVKNLSVKKDTIKPNTFVVSYFYIDIYSKKTIAFTIHTTVVKQANSFKLENVW